MCKYPLLLIAAVTFFYAQLSTLTYAADATLQSVAVEKREVEQVRWFDGVVEAINSTTVSAQTSGRIVSLEFDVDDFVQAGEVIVQIADIEHKARLSQAIANLDAANATRQGAEEEFNRVKQLLSSNTVSRARYDSAKAAFDAAAARVNTAAAAVDQAREQLEYTTVRAPYSGLVKARHVELGEVASPGQPLMTGFSLEQLRVSVSVPQQLAGLIRANHHAVVKDDQGGVQESTKLVVFPFADVRSNTVTVRASLPEGTERFFPGMLVKIGFQTGRTEKLIVPASAVVQRGEVTAVYRIDAAGRLQLQQIRAGSRNSNGVEVLSGLRTGDQIALDAAIATEVRHRQNLTAGE